MMMANAVRFWVAATLVLGMPALTQAAPLVAEQPFGAADIVSIAGGAEALMAARAALAAGNLEASERALGDPALSADAVLAPWASALRGELALRRNDPAAAVSHFDASLKVMPALEGSLLRSNIAAWLAAQPQRLVDRFDSLSKLVPAEDLDGRSLLYEARAQAEDKLGKAAEARATRLRRWLEEPVSLATPPAPPEGSTPTLSQRLARAEKLGEAHRNERVIEELGGFSENDVAKGLSADERCRRRFALGLAHRKLHNYADAEGHLDWVVKTCGDDLSRRAMYLSAKVVSIRDGLRAVPIIDAFAKRFPQHSMTDDVLFWAGDLYQRRGREADALRYYNRVDQLTPPGDQCAEARWRIAWMAVRANRHAEAIDKLRRLLLPDGCVTLGFDRARAHYWLAMTAAARKDTTTAVAELDASLDEQLLGFYGQLSMARLRDLDPGEYARRVGALPKDLTEKPRACPGRYARDPRVTTAVDLLARNLDTDATALLRVVAGEGTIVVGKTHAESMGKDKDKAQNKSGGGKGGGACSTNQETLFLAILFDEAGAYRDAHWRLRTELSELIDGGGPPNLGILHVAYPLAYRELTEAAEKESDVPRLLLQALAREESAFDPQAVSWAGAYGLTQLLLSSGRGAAGLLPGNIRLSRGEDLLDAPLNARLGGALLGSLVEKLGGHPALALAGYNASEQVARTWWQRHGGEPLDVFAEEMTIAETRGYVKRVLRTWGIYRWLYGGEAPVLAAPLVLPNKPN